MSLKICGIYKITNIKNNKIYIGLSKNIRSRFNEHKSCLRNNIHKNQHLQNSWNCYGEDNFIFEIIEECNENELNEKEIYYIQKYQSYMQNIGYNNALGGNRNIPTPEALQKQIDVQISKPIIQIDMFNNIVKRWSGARRASKELGITYNGIFCCLKGEYITFKNYIWIYESDFNNFDFDLHMVNSKKHIIVQCDLNKNIIRLWNSAKEAETLGFDRSAISKCCKGIAQKHKGYVWIYYEDYIKQQENQNKDSLLLCSNL